MLKSKKIDLKEHSHKVVLDLIRRNGQLSGAEIARRIGMQPSSIHYILQSLKDHDLTQIASTGESTKQGGKPPMLWELKRGQHHFLGVEVLRTSIRMVMLDLSSEELARDEVLIEGIIGDPASFISEHIKQFIKKSKIKETLVGCAIAVTGLVDKEGTSIVYSRELNLKNYALAKNVQKIISQPVIVVNDANAGVVGYNWFNKKAPLTNTIYLNINMNSSDIGAGLILGDKYHTGRAGIAGEFLESLPSITTLFSEGMDRLGISFPIVERFNEKDYIRMKDVLESFTQGCKISEYILKQEAAFLAHEMCRLIALIDPDTFVIGGDATETRVLLNDFTLPAIEVELSEKFPIPMQLPPIVFSEFGRYASAFGAAALLMQKQINP